MKSEDSQTYDASYVKRLEEEAETLRRQNQELLESLRSLQDEMTSSILSLKRECERLTEELRLARSRTYGPKSEKVAQGQMVLSIFNEVEREAVPGAPEPELEEGPLEKAPARKRRRGGKRRIDTSKLEREVIDHVIEDPTCPACGGHMEEMKVEVREVIRLVPAHLVVEEHRTHVYTCACCSKKNAEGQDVKARIISASHGALTPIPNSFATASLIASIINAKYMVASPLYRLELEFESQGIEISRQDMANWVIGVYERWLSLIYGHMRQRLLQGSFIHADETEAQVLKEEGREASQKSRMWVFRSGKHDAPCVIYVYAPTRSKDVAERFLSGWSGYLTTDGYSPYFHLANKGVTNTACLVHIRRKFCEIVKAEGGDSKAKRSGSVALCARARIDRMFRVDSRFDDMDAEERKQARLEQLRPLMEDFEAWAEGERSKCIPRSALERAFSYALKLWPYVGNVLLDGNLELDNNIAERSIKPFVIGRKNWLFSNSAKGAEASAAIYSIMISARECGLNQRTYIEWLLTAMPDDEHLKEPGALDKYLPWSEEAKKRCQRK